MSIRPMVAATPRTRTARDFTGKPMLIYRRTSLLESTAQTIVNTVNCAGVMGKGIAKDFKAREPEMFAAYKRICEDKLLAPGKLWLWRGSTQIVLNFPTKQHWKNPSKLEWIEAGLKKFVSHYQKLGIVEISFPRLGCGNGGLDWKKVRPLMEKYLSRLPIQVYIHDYTVDVGLPEHMEEVAKQLRSENLDPQSFDAFLAAIEKAVTVGADKLVNIESNERLAASVTNDRGLLVETNHAKWNFDAEDLRGAWVSLQRGLLTKDKAAWSQEGAGDTLLSILCVLPQVRPVQIQPITQSPEVALELRPGDRGSDAAPASKSQLDLAWR
jgi:O-acetyl-ADP-ribose deacetylase (regulator of RNase III)